MMEQMARNAQTDQQLSAALAGARQALSEAHTPEEAAALRKVVHMLENQDSLPAQHKSTGKSRWTRIADSCGSGAAQR